MQPISPLPVVPQSDREGVATCLENVVVPQGWKLVPVDPTEEMIDAMRKAINDALSGVEPDNEYAANEFEAHVAGYDAALAFAPEQP